MNPFQVRTAPFTGTSYPELAPRARLLLRALARKTKRHAYIRSAYFRKEKIFFTYFWTHLAQKSPQDRTRRLKYLPCAVELLQKSRVDPMTKENPNRPGELVHRFTGITRDKELFYVQVKEDKRSGRKELMSVFPEI